MFPNVVSNHSESQGCRSEKKNKLMDLNMRSSIFSGMIFISPMKKPEFDAEANEDVPMEPSNAEALDQSWKMVPSLYTSFFRVTL